MMAATLSRPSHLKRLRALLRQSPVVAILGTRQVGKSTLARELADGWRGQVEWFDLEDPVDQRRLADPGRELRRLRGLVVLDEIHRLPEVFPLLRVLADRPRTPARFLVLGSASPQLLRQGSESLAGRIAFHELDGFALEEIEDLDRLWLRGGLPRSTLARGGGESDRWRQDFVRTFLERDLSQLGVSLPAPTVRRFWTMLAHWHGQLWNAAEFARSFGVSHTTVRRYLDLLSAVFVVRQLPPWFENLSKRQVKSPKVYVSDSGLLHTLLGISSMRTLMSHPKVGASWEGFVLGQVTHALRARPEECYHWSTHSGASLDLLVVRGNRRLGFEMKLNEAPEPTKSMHVAMKDLQLQKLDVVHGGDRTFDLAPGIRALAASRLRESLRPLR